MVIYPAAFPCPSRIEGHSQAMNAGLVRTPMEAGNARQRRTHRILPTRISLVFVIDQKDYAAWLTWINSNAWDGWVSMKLPGLEASRLGLNTAAIAVRFITDLQATLMPVHRLWYWNVRVEAEYIPTPEQLAPVPIGHWIIAGTPGNPAPDWIIAGTPPLPSVDVISSGTIAAPAALIT
jgi:hypothetical protein